MPVQNKARMRSSSYGRTRKTSKAASVFICMMVIAAAFFIYNRQLVSVDDLSPPLSPMEIKIKDHHRYWDQVAATTNACVPDNILFNRKTPSGMYAEMPQKLAQIPTDNIDPDIVRTVYKYLEPGLGRLSNFDQMSSQLGGKIVASLALFALTLGSSEAVDAVDVTVAATDMADGADAAVAVADIPDMADIGDIADMGAMADITDKIDAAGGLEAIAGKMPSKGLLGISSTIKYFKEKQRIPGVKHVVEYRTERARTELQQRYGGTFQKINLDLPTACTQ